MNLSHDYRNIHAVFDRPPPHEITQPSSYFGKGELREFTIGPFKYSMLIREVKGGRTYSISFLIDSIIVDDEELAEYLTKVHHKPCSIHDAQVFRQEVSVDPYEVLYTGQAFRVFGRVFEIIRDFVDRIKPRCLKFSSEGESRTALYHRMIRKFFPGYRVKIQKMANLTLFDVCLPL